MLRLLGFPEIFSNWITNCMTTVTYSVVVNGRSIAPFSAKKGLRQVDPMSPFLFVLAMEYLSRMLKTLKTTSVFIQGVLKWILYNWDLLMIYSFSVKEMSNPWLFYIANSRSSQQPHV